MKLIFTTYFIVVVVGGGGGGELIDLVQVSAQRDLKNGGNSLISEDDRLSEIRDLR